MPTWADWLVMVAALAYLVIAVTQTDGPANVFERARALPYVGKLFECSICAALWLALLVFWLYTVLSFLVMAMALAGAFVLGSNLWDMLSAPKRVQLERERIENAEEILSTLAVLNDENLNRVVIGHYLGGVDLGAAIYLGLNDAKQNTTFPN